MLCTVSNLSSKDCSRQRMRYCTQYPFCRCNPHSECYTFDVLIGVHEVVGISDHLLYSTAHYSTVVYSISCFVKSSPADESSRPTTQQTRYLITGSAGVHYYCTASHRYLASTCAGIFIFRSSQHFVQQKKSQRVNLPRDKASRLTFHCAASSRVCFFIASRHYPAMPSHHFILNVPSRHRSNPLYTQCFLLSHLGCVRPSSYHGQIRGETGNVR